MTFANLFCISINFTTTNPQSNYQKYKKIYRIIDLELDLYLGQFGSEH